MKVVLIGRTKALYDTASILNRDGHTILAIITSKEAPEYQIRAQDFEDLASQLQCKFYRTVNIVELCKSIYELGPDVAVSVNYAGLIPQKFIDIFEHGVLNAHGGDLPKYRGNACQAWAILNGENRIGLCVHKMVGDELDSGEIILRKYLKISGLTKISEVYDWMYQEIPGMFLDSLEKLEKSDIENFEIQPIDPKQTLRCFPRRPSDAQISWSSSAIDIQRLIHASGPPFDGAFFYFENQKVYIYDCDIMLDGPNILAVDGQIIDFIDDALCVACGSNQKIKLRNMYVNGHKIVPADFFRTIRNRLS